MRYLANRIIVLIVAALIGGGAYGYQTGKFEIPGLGQEKATADKASSQKSGQAKTTDCERPKQPVVVELSKSKYPNIVAHIRESWREGYPKVLKINREGADERRDALLADVPTKDGYDRDEAPAAVLRDEVDASVKYIPSSENRSAGSSLGSQIAPYCDGTKVRYRFVP